MRELIVDHSPKILASEKKIHYQVYVITGIVFLGRRFITSMRALEHEKQEFFFILKKNERNKTADTEIEREK